MLSDGSPVQTVISKPDYTSIGDWLDRRFESTSAICDTSSLMGAALVFRFQAFKEAQLGTDPNLRNTNWLCFSPEDPTMDIHQYMINHNERRIVNRLFSDQIYRTITVTRSATIETIRCMVKTQCKAQTHTQQRHRQESVFYFMPKDMFINSGILNKLIICGMLI